jgi:hypothetical protein
MAKPIDLDLQTLVDDFVDNWAPRQLNPAGRFIAELRALLEAYGRAALRHQSLPDTEHEHGDPAC